MARFFCVVGDSNVLNHVTNTSRRAHPLLKSSQIVPCGHLAVLSESLLKVKGDVTACILSCVSNCLSEVEVSTSSSVASRIEPVLQELRTIIFGFCDAVPARAVLVAPPMYRTSPVWYRDGLPVILTSFSSAMSQERPPNLHLLPSFPTPEFGDDGVHLSGLSGLEFVLHLFDQSELLLEGLSAAPEVTLLKNCEATRVLEDRVLVLEQDHRRLNRIVENKIAVDSELADFRENERYEDCFIIEGLPLIPPEIVGKPWQELAKKHVYKVITPLIGREMRIVVVQNVTNRFAGAEVKYSVKMSSVADSKAIRDKFGSFFVGSKDQRPDEFKPYSIRNRVTAETKIRISILKLLGRRYQDANPGSRVQVIGFDPRPMIKISPSASASDRRVKSFNFIEAVRVLPTSFTTAESESLLKYINGKFLGKLRSLFIVLSDDQFKKIVSKRSRAPNAGGGHSSASAPSGSGPSSGSSSGASAGAVVGADASPNSESSGSRGSKRGADTTESGAAKRWN